MIRYGPSKRRDGRFDYTMSNHMKTWEIGYCQSWSDIEEDKDEIKSSLPGIWDRLKDNKDKFHDTGHETPEEACECYREYVIEVQLDLDIVDDKTQKKCEVCGDWTQGRAKVNDLFEEFILCDEHRTRRIVGELMEEITVITRPESF